MTLGKAGRALGFTKEAPYRRYKAALAGLTGREATRVSRGRAANPLYLSDRQFKIVAAKQEFIRGELSRGSSIAQTARAVGAEPESVRVIALRWGIIEPTGAARRYGYVDWHPAAVPDPATGRWMLAELQFPDRILMEDYAKDCLRLSRGGIKPAQFRERWGGKYVTDLYGVRHSLSTDPVDVRRLARYKVPRVSYEKGGTP